jgi:hypothetical protein
MAGRIPLERASFPGAHPVACPVPMQRHEIAGPKAREEASAVALHCRESLARRHRPDHLPDLRVQRHRERVRDPQQRQLVHLRLRPRGRRPARWRWRRLPRAEGLSRSRSSVQMLSSPADADLSTMDGRPRADASVSEVTRSRSPGTIRASPRRGPGTSRTCPRRGSASARRSSCRRVPQPSRVSP